MTSPTLPYAAASQQAIAIATRKRSLLAAKKIELVNFLHFDFILTCALLRGTLAMFRTRFAKIDALLSCTP